MKKHIILTLISAILLLLHSCSFPEVKTPIFERETQAIVDDLKALHNFEDAGVNWKTTISTEQSATNILSITLLNGENLSEDEDKLKELGKDALKIVVNSIENENDYNSFQVIFMQQKSFGIVNKSFSKQFAFDLENLN